MTYSFVLVGLIGHSSNGQIHLLTDVRPTEIVYAARAAGPGSTAADLHCERTKV